MRILMTQAGMSSHDLIAFGLRVSAMSILSGYTATASAGLATFDDMHSANLACNLLVPNQLHLDLWLAEKLKARSWANWLLMTRSSQEPAL